MYSRLTIAVSLVALVAADPTLNFEASSGNDCSISYNGAKLVTSCTLGAGFGDPTLASRVSALETAVADLQTKMDRHDELHPPTDAPTTYPTPTPTKLPELPTMKCQTIQQGGGTKSQTATASCPAGWTLTGGGFSDIDQDGGGSASDEFHSRPEGNNWFIRFDDEVGGFDSYAICCRAEAGTSGNPHPHYELECSTVNQGGGSNSQTATALCPSGTQLMGGGFNDIDQNGGGSASDEFHSRPNGANNGWYVRFEDEVGGFNAYARCCKYKTVSSAADPASLQCRTEQKGGGNKNTAVTANCNSDEYVVGGGFSDIDQNGGGSASDEFHSRPSGNGWYVRFEDEVGGFDSYARCCKKSS